MNLQAQASDYFSPFYHPRLIGKCKPTGPIPCQVREVSKRVFPSGNECIL